MLLNWFHVLIFYVYGHVCLLKCMFINFNHMLALLYTNLVDVLIYLFMSLIKNFKKT